MPKNKSKLRQITLEQYKILVPALVTILVAVIGGFCGILGPIVVKYFEVKVIATPIGVTPNSSVPENTENAPKSTPESFSPFGEVDPNALSMVEGPTPDIYISKGYVYSRLQSFVAHLSSSTQVPAESKVCLINKGYPPPERRPLNLSAHSITFNASIYSEANGKLTITGYQMFIERSPISEKIRSLEILTGGAGGGDTDPFVIMELPILAVTTPIQKEYKQEISWLDLYKGEGVAFSIPIELGEDGQYSIQVKFFLIFTSQDPAIESKQLSLTTGQSEYSWLLIDNPRSYSLSAGIYPVDLIDCP